MVFNLFKKINSLAGIFCLFLLMCNYSHAGLINIDVFKEVGDSIIDPSDTFALDFTGLTQSSSDVMITFTVFGDFSNQNEWIDLSANSYSFGRWLNHTNIDDSINGPGTSDTGNEYESFIVGWTKLSSGDFNNLLQGNNELTFLFDYNRSAGNDRGVLSYVNNLQVGDYAKVEMSYTGVALPSLASVVPEPSENIMLIIGLIGVILLKRLTSINEVNYPKVP
jgi:hypothetical protein